MKKLSCLTMLLLSATIGFSQVRFGVTAGGLSSGNTIRDYSENTNGEIFEYSYKPRFGYSGGLVVTFPAGKTMAIRTEVLYTQKGADIKANDETDEWTNNVVLEYIELPINLVATVPGKTGKFFLGGGAYAAYGIKGELTRGHSGDKQEIVYGPENDNDITANAFDYGFNLLAGYEFRGGFSFNLRYARGMNDVFNSEGNKKNQNYLFGLYLGYNFKSKH